MKWDMDAHDGSRIVPVHWQVQGGDARDVPPSQCNFLYFHAVLVNIFTNNRLPHPSLDLVHPLCEILGPDKGVIIATWIAYHTFLDFLLLGFVYSKFSQISVSVLKILYKGGSGIQNIYL